MASKTLKNVYRATGVKTKRKQLFPDPHGKIEEEDENENESKVNPLAVIGKNRIFHLKFVEFEF